jgi:hypothetical protein
MGFNSGLKALKILKNKLKYPWQQNAHNNNEIR